ncbi:MAG: GntP family permease, partial [Planctomycetaceae bacterium]|nr:GntP family permease [Planctomycetaceae bacterium]
GRVNAFLALITAAVVVSLLAPGDPATKITRVATAFGTTAGKIGIVIATAAIIGECMMLSGAADRVVRAFMHLLGEKHTPLALMSSGYVLSVPVFFDTVFYLLVPLARSMFRRTGANFLLYLLAICAGGAVTHTLVPPTPGPLAMAAELQIEIGTMMLVGALVGIPMSLAGLLFAAFVNRKMPIPLRHAASEEHEQLRDDQLPNLLWSVLPVALPVLMISTDTIVKTLAKGYPAALATLDRWTGAMPDVSSGTVGFSGRLAQCTAVVGDANFAMLVSLLIALIVLKRQRKYTAVKLAGVMESSLMSAGVIILITSAGGAFGAMLTEADIKRAIEGMFLGSRVSGMLLLLLGFGISALFKVAQGSSTVAMITTAGIMNAFVPDESVATYNVVYLATAIGSGSLVGSWMNDSGFWIVTKMGGLTEVEGLKTWTPLLAVLGVTGLLVTLLLSQVFPLTVMPA